MKHLREAIALVFPLLTSLVQSAWGQPYLPEALPLDMERIVVGTWRLIEPDIKCTRSIEQVANAFFMVARCPEIAGVDGSRGLPLVKVSGRVFRNQAGSTYEIQEDGMLVMVNQGHVDMRGKPQKELWPQ